MKFYKKLSMEQVAFLIENCKHSDGSEIAPKECETCPLNGECLYYYTGDDSLLYED